MVPGKQSHYSSQKKKNVFYQRTSNPTTEYIPNLAAEVRKINLHTAIQAKIEKKKKKKPRGKNKMSTKKSWQKLHRRQKTEERV